ncbi:hypothetical protein ACRYCC_20980 [Actinomadura scrupuli]|uniref:hypothetical protein n=1 Tax=Actinomadura scrupuli TaxID=559629 RepID=UPI003D992581
MTSPLVLGADAGSPTVPEAEHLISDLVALLGLGDGVVACTHFVRGDRPHVAVSLELAGPIDLAVLPPGTGAELAGARTGPAPLAETAAGAAREHAARRSGRLVRYPGAGRLTGTLTVGALLDGSAIDRVQVLAGGGTPAPHTPVHTRDHVRPEWRDGLMTLLAMPAGEAALALFEVPDPTPCCADHA